MNDAKIVCIVEKWNVLVVVVVLVGVTLVVQIKLSTKKHTKMIEQGNDNLNYL
jgi:hypothetical protein